MSKKQLKEQTELLVEEQKSDKEQTKKVVIKKPKSDKEQTKKVVIKKPKSDKEPTKKVVSEKSKPDKEQIKKVVNYQYMIFFFYFEKLPNFNHYFRSLKFLTITEMVFYLLLKSIEL